MTPLTRFVLLHTSHAGNVGAVARAMKVMGFDDLVLVAPRWPDVLERTEAIERASGAGDVLAKARVVDTLEQALAGIDHVCATAMTPRDFGPPVLAPRTHFAQLLAPQAARPQAVALVFGSERFGMRNEDVYRCHACLSIPTSPTYGSLNIAAAVQLIAYDWREALGAYPVQAVTAQTQPADAVQVAIGFLDPAAPKKLMPRLQQLFNRARPSQQDIHILRGIARAVQADRGADRGKEGVSAAPPVRR
jgi:tRNA/rRNA methyltransferase